MNGRLALAGEQGQPWRVFTPSVVVLTPAFQGRDGPHSVVKLLQPPAVSRPGCRRMS